MEIVRLGATDIALARRTLHLMDRVFEAPEAALSDEYLRRLLARREFWAVAALLQGEPVGGLTAHALPMTRNESTELFIYDLAVDPARQRQGVGRALVSFLRTHASAEGIDVVFVPAENEDEHALDFYRAIGGEPAAVTIFSWGE